MRSVGDFAKNGVNYQGEQKDEHGIDKEGKICQDHVFPSNSPLNKCEKQKVNWGWALIVKFQDLPESFQQPFILLPRPNCHPNVVGIQPSEGTAVTHTNPVLHNL